MRKFLLAAALSLATAATTAPASAVEPNEVPWDEIDRVLKEDETARDPATSAAPARADDAASDASPAATSEAAARNAIAPTETAPTEAEPADAATAQPDGAAPGTPAAPQIAAAEKDLPVYDGPEDPNAGEVLPDGAADDADLNGKDEAAELPPGATAKVEAPSYTLPIGAYLIERGRPVISQLPAGDQTAISEFYATHQDGPIWVDAKGFNENALKLIEVLSSANDWGLDASSYDTENLSRLLPAGGAESLSDDVRIEAELRATVAAIQYARDARGGRIEKPAEQLSSYLDRKPRVIETPVLLERLAADADRGVYLTSLHPKHPQFEKLRQLLIKTRNEKPEAIAQIPRGKVIKPGRTHPHVALIRSRLKVPSPGMKPDGTAAGPDYYDETLGSAVKRYKEQFGLTPVTTAITQALRNSLNADRSISEPQILANMEQWRWMPDDLGAFHIAVNVPEFLVRVNDNGKQIHEERVITGQTNTQTPIFSHKMRSVTFQPVWNVPQSIIVNEILPGLRAGRNSIAARGLVMKRNDRFVDPWSVDWYTRDIRAYHIYQPPGPGNALGIVKFMFPNKHAVYLHDTPTKNLFNSTTRNFSHGCVRVRNPGRLAEIIMAHDRDWDKEQVGELLRGGPENNDIVLNTPIPVHITYFTLWVDDGGNVRSFNDVYGHERRITYALQGKWDRIAIGEDHLKPVTLEPASRPAPRRQYSDWDYFFDGYPPPSNRDRRRRSRSASNYEYGYDGYPPNSRRARQRRQAQPSFFEQLFGN